MHFHCCTKFSQCLTSFSGAVKRVVTHICIQGQPQSSVSKHKVVTKLHISQDALSRSVIISTVWTSTVLTQILQST
ncbi:hypothetical protein L798_15254 [Zootermopsis nevadensis]|uniref:Uncharacterized protein n=1 Tax=Zootermopsis nevadensis TaxID=136037 RepID=A0A067QZJ1_ZOONE|nr:hypothetical protein L798_15254 [Zootermopsis nevadensis]